MTSGYAKLRKSSNLLQENPKGKKSWKKLAWGTPLAPCPELCQWRELEVWESKISANF